MACARGGTARGCAGAADAPPSTLPLAGVRVVELGGLAPGPFAGMMLADFGADVVKVEGPAPGPPDVLSRGKRSVALDLKAEADRDHFLAMCDGADVCIDPFRPGVLEDLRLDPAELCRRNPRLIVARLTGYGQDGPMAPRAGHDINYLAQAGTLHLCVRGPEAPPMPPANLLADFAGGGLMCVNGVLLALLQRGITGRGDVVDVSMVEGASYLSSFVHRFQHVGMWDDSRPGRNILDGGAPFYGSYRCKDGGWLAVGPVEGKFFRQLLSKLGLDEGLADAQFDQGRWPELRAAITDVVASRTRDEWGAEFEGSDACAVPVMSLEEAANHPHARARGSFGRDTEDCTVPVPAPRFSGFDARSALQRPATAERVPADAFQWRQPRSKL